MFGLALSIIVAHSLCGASPADAEMAAAKRWVSAKFEGVAQVPAAPPDSIEVVANHGPVQANARSGEPLRVNDATFTRGLYCHAPSKLIIRLSKPARQFDAVAGIDARANGGSVIFSLRSDDAERWNSGVVRFGAAGIPVAVPLEGAKEFVLEIGDAGDGISCDQSNWADARVTLEDGSVVWLGDMPILSQPPDIFPNEPFFSFNYGDRPFSELLPNWKMERATEKLDDARTQHTLTYTDSETGLVVRCVAVEYRDFPTVEWTLYFKNTGKADTPILSDIQAIDARFGAPAGGAPEAGGFILHHNKGDNCVPDSYEPLVDVLGAKADLRLANTGGRPTQIGFPYFNLAGLNEGMIFVVSWAGQWNAQFTRDDTNALRLRAGQEQTHFTLHPGEEVRSPMILLQFYKCDWLRGQNIWRAWMVAHNMPHQDGKPLKPQICLCTGNYYPGLMSNAQAEIKFIRKYVEEGIQPDYWWQDAGWYPCDGVTWPKTGTWEVDPVRFPKGLREVGDFARTHGIKTLVWFEPERVHPDTWLTQNHPEWVHGGAGGGLLKLGDPKCRAWLTDHIDRLLTEQGIDFYRQDFNIDPLPFWRAADAEESPAGERQGIAEIRHVEGYFAYWDELIRRHPGMPIDSCASGGRRNDLETLRRAVPLLRSDWYAGEAGQQCQTYGLSLWVPFNGTGVISQKDAYWMRSSMVAEFTFGPDAAGTDVIDFAQLRARCDEWRKLASCFLSDFYPLTSYTLAEDQWMAWQYNRADMGEGAVQAFRRQTSFYEAARFKLHGIDANARYRITNLDDGSQTELSGQELAEQGLPVVISQPARAAIYIYKRLG